MANYYNNYTIRNFEVIFNKYYIGLVAFVERHVGDHELSKDIVQDIFFKLYKNSYKFNNEVCLKSWLYTSARNEAIDYLRTLKVRDSNELLLAEAMMYSSNVDEDINENLCRMINIAISKLPEQCRRIVCMNVFEGKKYSEIAEILNISINTVRTQISRGYKYLRKELSLSYKFLSVILIYMLVSFMV